MTLASRDGRGVIVSWARPSCSFLRNAAISRRSDSYKDEDRKSISASGGKADLTIRADASISVLSRSSSGCLCANDLAIVRQKVGEEVVKVKSTADMRKSKLFKTRAYEGNHEERAEFKKNSRRGAKDRRACLKKNKKMKVTDISAVRGVQAA